ncbi:MAG: GatB/YqeY domain-containing protein [Desulfobacterales bacterium]
MHEPDGRRHPAALNRLSRSLDAGQILITIENRPNGVCWPNLDAWLSMEKWKKTMDLKETIKRDLKAAMKNRDEARKDALRVVLGELARSATKAADDDSVIQTLRKLRKSEKELLQQSARGDSSPFLQIIEGYLPQTANEAEIRQWIAQNIDFDSFPSRMQAMKPIMAHFGGRADGATIRRILENL